MKKLLSMSVATLLWSACTYVQADHLVETSHEVRIILYYHVSPDVLAKFLPAGWVAADLTTGAGTGANLTVNLSDQLSNAAAKGVAATADTRGQGITISARVKDPQTGENRAMVLFGFTNGEDSPGPYGTHRKATINMTRTERTQADGRVTIRQLWAAKTSTGDALNLDLSFVRGPLVPLQVDQQTRSSLHPDFYRIYKQSEQADVVRTKANPKDSVLEFKMTEAGEAAKFIDKLQKPIAIVSIPVFYREIWLPN
jgi:hypothetical protein